MKDYKVKLPITDAGDLYSSSSQSGTVMSTITYNDMVRAEWYVP